MNMTDLPLTNALLNGTSTLLLMTGYVFIRTRNVRFHKMCMISALSVSTLFLISYLVYHYNVGSVAFTGRGIIRPLYFSILVSHTMLALSLPPLAIITLIRALRTRFDKHRTIARWTLPIWLYVSITGVVIYLMLYRWFPSINQ
jgi:uncharacterized membrane protein YozB (DUF420 family)